MNRTKIICTLGPASNNEETIKQMLQTGMNVARINFSHGTHESHGNTIDLFRKVRDTLGLAAAVMLDTKGPEIRLGDFQDGSIDLEIGDAFTFTTDVIMGNKSIAHINYAKLPRELAPGDTILVDDGLMRFEVKGIDGNNIFCVALTEGSLSNHKGVNIPHNRLKMEYLGEKDKDDLLFGIKKDVDYVAASFTRKAQDVLDMRRFLDENGGNKIRLICKIENMEGIENFEEILKLSDGIMIARGDMGVEVPYEKLPGIQKHFIKRCKETGKIVITATQMLESMIENPVPTRAEITDIANAVFEGTSAVMLSGESAAGKHPVEAVNTMFTIVSQSEKDYWKYGESNGIRLEKDREDITNAVGHGACTIAKDIKASALLAITKTGYTATRMSKYRPNMIIIGATPDQKVFHQMALSWGVAPIIAEAIDPIESMFSHCLNLAKEKGLICKDQLVVISLGVPLNVEGNTNTIRVERVQ